VHGTHFDPDAIRRVREAGATIAHCPRSNMNNGVGTAPMAAYNCPIMLGTDGHSSDMFLEAKVAWLAARQDRAPIPPSAVVVRLAQAARRASDALEITLGKLERDAVADVVVTDYRPATPLTDGSLAAHFLGALGAHHVKDVMADGQWALRDRVVKTCDEQRARDGGADVAARLWSRRAQIQ